MKSLREVCNIIGVDRHVLQRLGTSKNGEKPLLPPTVIHESSGYWFYDEEAIEKLWLIMLFRELGCTYKQIREIFNSSDFNQHEWFGKQIELLKKKKAYIDKLIYIAEMIHTCGMMPTEIDNVRDYTIGAYIEHTKNKFDSVSDKTKQRVEKIFADASFNMELKRIFDICKNGVRPQDARTQELVGNMYRAFNSAAMTSDSRAFRMFGKMMNSNGEFSYKIDEVWGKDTSRFVGEAIDYYLKKKE